MTQAKLVFIFINHKVMINHAIECIVLNWQDYSIQTADLGTARVGERVTLSLEWDQANHLFIFQRIGGGGRFTHLRDNGAEVSLSYTVPDIQPPGVKFRRLEVSESLTNCGIIQPQPVGFIDAYFDNVFVSQ